MSVSASAPKYTLETLAAATAKAPETVVETHGYYGRNVWVWLLVIFLIVLLILWLVQPNFVLSRDEKHCKCFLDCGKLIVWSIVIALAIVLLCWLFRPGYSCDYTQKKEVC